MCGHTREVTELSSEWKPAGGQALHMDRLRVENVDTVTNRVMNYGTKLWMVSQLEDVVTQLPIPPEESDQLQCRLLRDQNLATIEG